MKISDWTISTKQTPTNQWRAISSNPSALPGELDRITSHAVYNSKAVAITEGEHSLQTILAFLQKQQKLQP